MIIAGGYSFKDGKHYVEKKYPTLLEEIKLVIAAVSAKDHLTKESKEKTMPGKMLYSPSALNETIKQDFYRRGWKSVKVPCDYPTKFYSADYVPKALNKGAFREMDFVKKRLGIEVQFGKYAFMVYNVCAKMTIFRNLGHIDSGVEIVPIKKFADEMSTGVSYFEQFVWDLEHRGVADIDVPVLILGIDA
ncbi:MAG TPA: BglII/BstYI family type II restriction endonuclease [Candidatus Acidoferrales bacterium]|nr:BglII/BstYI family type II restriction endonuclease [Candidatus Acidoferrales bacterium]